VQVLRRNSIKQEIVMRNFNPPVQLELRNEIINLVIQILLLAPKIKQQFGSDLAMDDEDEVVCEYTKIDMGDDIGVITVAKSKEYARPPFEWIVEVTSEIGESEYFRHYLIRDDDMVLAQRKVITEVDDEEARLLIIDLKSCIAYLK
jgi:hypothetical protein